MAKPETIFEAVERTFCDLNTQIRLTIPANQFNASINPNPNGSFYAKFN